MKVKLKRQCAIALTIVGLLTGQLAQAAGPAVARTGSPAGVPFTVGDVALQEAGVLRGQLLDTAGAPEANALVSLQQRGQVIATTKTDQSGGFHLRGVSAGLYELETAHGRSAFRLWAPQTAPPVASQGVLLVSGRQVVRNQRPGWPNMFGGWFANPWILAGIVAAAIAIPLAIDDDDGS